MTFEEELDLAMRIAKQALHAEHGPNPRLEECFFWLLREYLSDKLERVRAAREPGVCTCPH